MKNKTIQNMLSKMEKNHIAQRKKVIKITATALCTALVLGGTGTTMYALANDNNGAAQDAAESTASTENGSAKTAAEKTDEKISKEETVYVLAGADGGVHRIIVSDWLKNGMGAERLEDISELIDIENIGGDEEFNTEAGNVMIWDAKGQDIYYQGSIEKELPIGITVSYKLDGKEISPEELAGKSGKVTIRFDYTNEQYEYIEIDGVQTKVYVPFAVVTGLILDNEVFTNIEISGGKMINDGGRTVVMGFALPGLQNNLGIDSDKLDIPDHFEIIADAREFELGVTATIATNELFNGIGIGIGIDSEDEDMIRELDGALGQLTDAMEQLEDGSFELYDGICTLLEKSGKLISGIDEISDGASQLQRGIGSLDDGVAKLQDGAVRLEAGLNTLTSKSGELNDGARQVFNTLLATANTQLAAAGLEVPAMTVENYADVLNRVIASLDDKNVYQQAYGQVSAAVEARRGEIEAAVTAAVRENVTQKVTAAVREQVEEQVKTGAEAEVVKAVVQTAMGMTIEEYDAALAGGLIDERTQAAVENAVSSQMSSAAVQKKITDTVEAQMTGADVRAAIEANINQQMAGEEVKGIINFNTEAQIQKAISDTMAGETVQRQFDAASEGAKSVIALKSSLDSYNAFYLGLQVYTAGVSQAADGAGELRSGTNELRDGTGKLYSGASKLCEGLRTMEAAAPALTDGIEQLRDGALRLYDGLCKFDEDGIQKLVDAVGGDLDNLMERFKATLEVSKKYQSFSGLHNGMDGQVKFIYRTDSIENKN